MKNEKRLETMSWNEIDEIARAGEGQKYFSVGDEKTITLDDGEQATLQILGFDHDNLADGTGKANITFGMKNLLATTYKINETLTNADGWNECLMRTKTMPMLFNKLPANLQNVIKTIDKKTTTGNTQTTIQISHDKLFLLSKVEIFSNVTEKGYVDEGTQYEYWSKHNINADRIKKLSNRTSTSNWWWLRSPIIYDTYDFSVIHYDGSYANNLALKLGGICFGFCV